MAKIKKTYPPYWTYPDRYYLFTDGSCWPNPDGPGGWAWVLVYNCDVLETDCGPLLETTTSRAELRAIQGAMRRTLTLPNATIVTDSAYCHNGYNTHFKAASKRGFRKACGSPLANLDIIRPTMAMFQPSKVKVDKIKGHNKNEFNELADKLCGEQRKFIAEKYGLY